MYKLQNASDLDHLLEDIGDARVVMLGEASHGTHEYYTWRTAISKRLIKEKGFNFIAVEGDWPDCYKINRYVKGYSEQKHVKEVMKEFNRWPTWMWANWEVAALAEWMHQYNVNFDKNEKIGFYGLDVYSLWDSMYEMVDYLEKEDPATARLVKKAIHCFEPFRDNEQAYARASITEFSCRDKVLNLLREVRLKIPQIDGDPEASFNTEQNALVSVNAEKYYRAMMDFDNESWNVRDRHMMETLDRLMEFHGPDAKGIVWEHNTHIGDARATDMRSNGMINIGQLARQHYRQENVYLVGFGSYKGSVIAGEEWGGEMQVMEVPEAREGSVEDILHQELNGNGYLLFSEENQIKKLSKTLPHRAIGVVYDPGRERYGNYVPTVMAERYNAFLFIDKTRALHPYEVHTDSHKMPETYPFGI